MENSDEIVKTKASQNKNIFSFEPEAFSQDLFEDSQTEEAKTKSPKKKHKQNASIEDDCDIIPASMNSQRDEKVKKRKKKHRKVDDEECSDFSPKKDSKKKKSVEDFEEFSDSYKIILTEDEKEPKKKKKKKFEVGDYSQVIPATGFSKTESEKSKQEEYSSQIIELKEDKEAPKKKEKKKKKFELEDYNQIIPANGFSETEIEKRKQKEDSGQIIEPVEDGKRERKKKKKHSLETGEIGCSQIIPATGVNKTESKKGKQEDSSQIIEPTEDVKKEKKKRKKPSLESDEISNCNQIVSPKKEKFFKDDGKNQKKNFIFSPTKRRKERSNEDIIIKTSPPSPKKKRQLDNSIFVEQQKDSDDESGIAEELKISSKLKSGPKNHKSKENFLQVYVETSSDEEVPKKRKSTEMKLAAMADEIHSKSEVLDEKLEMLQTLSVLLPWPVHPLHTIETRVTDRPTADQRQRLNSLGVKIRNGNYSKMEDKQIRQNWKDFCRIHDVNFEPSTFCNFRNSAQKEMFPRKERIKFVQFLAHNLPDRLLCGVYKRFKRLFSGESKYKTKFSLEEDETILDYVDNTKSKKPFSDLAKILNRDKLAICKRYRRLTDPLDQIDGKIHWTKENIEEFMKHFVDVTKVKEIQNLKDRRVTSEEWRQVAKRLGVSVQRLQYGWFSVIYPRIFIGEKYSYRTDVKKKMIQLLLEDGVDDWRRIDWQSLAKHFEGFTPRVLRDILNYAVSYHVPEELQGNLRESLKYLTRTKIKFFMNRIKKLKVIDKRNEDTTLTKECTD